MCLEEVQLRPQNKLTIVDSIANINRGGGVNMTT